MSDAAEASSTKAAAWTEPEKYQLLLKIIAQLSNGNPPKLSQIEMPGRTTKSLTHMWSKVKAELAQYQTDDLADDAAGDGAVKTPAGKKRSGGGEGDDVNVDETPKKKKTAAPRTPKVPKTPKAPKTPKTPKGKGMGMGIGKGKGKGKGVKAKDVAVAEDADEEADAIDSAGDEDAMEVGEA